MYRNLFFLIQRSAQHLRNAGVFHGVQLRHLGTRSVLRRLGAGSVVGVLGYSAAAKAKALSDGEEPKTTWDRELCSFVTFFRIS